MKNPIIDRVKGPDEKWGCGCAIIDNNKILLGLRCKATDKPEWSLPGGKIEEGETPFKGMCREVKEEVNLTIEGANVAGFIKNGEWLDFVFIADEYYHGEEKPQEGEFSELRWFTREELKEVPLYSFTIESLKLLETIGRF